MKLAPLALLAVLTLACSGPGDPTGATCPPSSTLTYENFGKELFAKACDGCHGSGGTQPPRFAGIEQIRASRGDIDRVAAKGPNATNTYMPDGRSLSDDDRAKLGEWLACGAP